MDYLSSAHEIVQITFIISFYNYMSQIYAPYFIVKKYTLFMSIMHTI